MSQQAKTAERQREHQSEHQSSESLQGGPSGPSGRSAPRDFPSTTGRGRHSHSRQAAHAAGQSEAPLGPPWGSTGSSYDSSSRGHLHGPRAGSSPSGGRGGFGGGSGSDSSRQHHHRTGTSAPATGSSSRGSSRYGQWPPPGSSPADSSGVAPRSGSGRPGSRQGPGTLRPSGSSSGRGFSFSWPAYMDRTQLQQAMKRGQVFRCAWLVNRQGC